MIYTSYFGKLKKIKERDDLHPISIARRLPRAIAANFPQLLELAPSDKLLDDYRGAKITKGQYVERYFKELPKDLYSIAERLSEQQKTPVLLCYEKPGDFCHRHILSAMIDELGFSCEELDI